MWLKKNIQISENWTKIFFSHHNQNGILDIVYSFGFEQSIKNLLKNLYTWITWLDISRVTSQLKFTCLKSTSVETLEKGAKYVLS